MNDLLDIDDTCDNADCTFDDTVLAHRTVIAEGYDWIRYNDHWNCPLCGHEHDRDSEEEKENA